MKLLAESINKDSRISTGKQWLETDAEDLGELLNKLQQVFGRCKGKIYIGDGLHVGYWFEKRRKWSDSDGTFLEETWVEIADMPENPRSTIPEADLTLDGLKFEREMYR